LDRGERGLFLRIEITANATYIPAFIGNGTVTTLTWNIPDPDGSGPGTLSSVCDDKIQMHLTPANAGPDFTICGAASVTLGANTAYGGVGQVV
jgi:hypothetical protein